MDLYLSPSLIRSCLSAARAAHPNESIALLHGHLEANGDIILDKMTIPSGISVARGSSQFLPWMLPNDVQYLGVFHSHPIGSAKPSRGDLLAAGREGGVQLIICFPYRPSDLKAYRADGTPMEYMIRDE